MRKRLIDFVTNKAATAKQERRISRIIGRGAYTDRQKAIIRAAIINKVDPDMVQFVAIRHEDGTPKYDAGQMIQLLYAIEAEVDISYMADPRIPADGMEQIRRIMEEDKAAHFIA